MIRRLVPSLAIAVVVASATIFATAVDRSQAPSAPQAVGGALELLFDQGKRLFDEFKYDQAVPLFDRLITAMAAGDPQQHAALLVQTYEMRARARFAMGNASGAEQDFAALLALRPDFRMGAGISPRVVAVFDNVRALTVGQARISLTPAGEIDIDGRKHQIGAEGTTLDLSAGPHQVSSTRPGYAPVTQTLTITAGQSVDLPLTLQRVSAFIEVNTTEPGVEVFLDGQSRGVTAARPSGGGSLTLGDLPLGPHRVRLRRDCYVELDRSFVVADDVRTEPLALDRATAAVKIETTVPGATIFVDGASTGAAPGTVDVCQGTHVIEVRAAEGRFVDRRDWRTGDRVTLTATIRRAFPIVTLAGSAQQPVLDQLRNDLERIFAPAKDVLIYSPASTELSAALQGENVPPDWLTGAISRAPTALPRDVIRELGRRLAARLGVQGFVAVVAGDERFVATVGVLAAGSGEPEVFTISTADQASQARALDRLSGPLPAILRPSLGIGLVDVASVKGAVVVRSAASSPDAGPVTGDVIVGAAGKPVMSVADLRAVMAGLDQAGSVTLDVSGADGQTRQVSATTAMVPDLLPLRDSSLLYNRAVLTLGGRAATALSPIEKASAQLNLAIALIRLGNWDDALAALDQVKLDDGPGVSTGTVSYLRGLALEGAGRGAEARAAFTEAASAASARLGSDGPLIAPLARQKLAAAR
jgi:tetratricopeptide (TPR) repeat protein